MVVLWTEQDHCVTKQKLSSLGDHSLFAQICNSERLNINFLVFRFCPQLSEDIAMDEKDDAKLVKILWETKVDMVRNNSKVCKLAQLLK